MALRTVVLLVVVAGATAGAKPKPDPDCVRRCDDAFKQMAVECRVAEKGGRGGKLHPGEAKSIADSCRANVAKLKNNCLKECNKAPTHER
ncbi:MAG: hypothetical protein INH41_09010 [Myxococcaceae bacterium]|nr:hypothetical protein [Myxococcaceae bacterium]